ncbi:RDD family protein [Alkalihalobacillus hwajinpoensis]|uniref:RDD family protein n=1 Tax=Guptibacillus hwajinpoensis TaxID=208199 RepID=UPI00188393DA|nr:RDD family protein [Pseudalkalibacillus hwajinpoensis]MBF0707822.1 RDD family protein [Pseudalkalibacillus hwajinpoensis]
MRCASFKIRIYAFLLDYLIIIAYGIFVVGTISIVFRSYMNSFFSVSPITAELTGFFMMTLPVSLYFILSESSKWQGTWGKRRMNIRVVDNEGDRIRIGRSFIRTAVKFIPWEVAHFGIWRLMLPTEFPEITIYIMLCAVNLTILLYLIIPFTNKRKKSIYDWAAGTVVVN